MKYCAYILLTIYEWLIFYIGLLGFGIACLLWSLVAAVLQLLMPYDFGRRLGRIAIMMVFRTFLAYLRLTGRFQFDLSALDALRNEKSLIIAPNHPSLWDVVLIISRLPDVVCVMKADIVNNIFLGGGARLARYIRNEPLRQMITLAVQDVQRGSQLLLFPEGTRTVQQPIGPLKGSIGVIASRAKVSVQVVFIETDSSFLTKGWPVYKRPRLPMTYRVRLGRRFDPPTDSAIFLSELQAYFVNELVPQMSPQNDTAVLSKSLPEPATVIAD